MRRIGAVLLLMFVFSVFAGMLSWHFKEGMKFLKQAKAKEDLFVLPGMIDVTKKYRVFLARKNLELALYHLYQAGLLAEKAGMLDKAKMYYERVVKYGKVRKHIVMKNIFGKVVFDKYVTVKADTDYVERARVKLEHFGGVAFLKNLKTFYRTAVKRNKVEEEMNITPTDEPLYAELAKKRKKLLAREEKYLRKIVNAVVEDMRNDEWKKFNALLNFADNSWKEHNNSAVYLYKGLKDIEKAFKFIIADLAESGQIANSMIYEGKKLHLKKVIFKVKSWLK